MNDIQVSGVQQFMGKEIPIVYGGFGKDKKCICDKTIAILHNQPVYEIRRRINDNIKRFEESIDFIDLKKGMGESQTYELLINLGYSKQMIIQAEHIYLLSQRGYLKLVKIMDSDQAWDIYNQVLDEYFMMKEEKTGAIPQGKELLALALVEANKMLEEKETENAQLQAKIEELKPKADYTDLILKSNSVVVVTQIAKDYGMSASEFNKLLYNLHIQFKVSKQWVLYAEYQDKGYTHSQTVSYNNGNGGYMMTKWTQKGRLFLYEELKKQGILPSIERRRLQVV